MIIEKLRDWGEQWKVMAKDLFDELMEIDGESAIDNYLSHEALERIRKHLKE